MPSKLPFDAFVLKCVQPRQCKASLVLVIHNSAILDEEAGALEMAPSRV